MRLLSIFLILFLLLLSVVLELAVIIAIGSIVSNDKNLAVIDSVEIYLNSVQGWFIFSQLGIIFFLIITASVVKSILNFATANVTYSASLMIAKTDLELYVNGYYGHSSKHSRSSVINNIINRINILTNSVVFHAVTILSSILAIICICAMLYFTSAIEVPIIFVAVMIVFFGFILYSIFYFLQRISNSISSFAQNSVEALLSIIENLSLIQIYRLSERVMGDFLKKYSSLRQAQVTLLWVSATPRIILELFLYLAIAYFVYLSSDTTAVDGRNFESVFFIGLLRLLPYFATIFSSVVSLSGALTDVEELRKFRRTLSNDSRERPTGVTSVVPDKQARDLIALDGIDFCYGDGNKVFNNFSLQVRRNEILGIKGASGSGKTTLINIVSGLLVPESGAIIASDALYENTHEHSGPATRLALVEQHVLIFPNTLRWNIKLTDGVDHDEDLRMLGILDALNFSDELDRGLSLETFIGDGHKQLSGGQVQRLGLARALYANKKLIILDEFTSALDSMTEEACLQTIQNLKSKATIVIVSHRSAPLNICDRVIEIT